MLDFCKSERTLIQTNINPLQVLCKTLFTAKRTGHSGTIGAGEKANNFQNELKTMLRGPWVHLFFKKQVLIKFLNCVVFWVVFNDSWSEFQIFGR